MQLHPFRLGRVTAPVLPASMSCCVLPISIAHDCIKILSMLGVIIGSFEPAWFHIYAYIYKIIEPIQCKVKNVNNQMIGFENKGTGNYSGGKLGVEFSNLSPFFVVVVLVFFFFLVLFLLVPFFMWDAWTLFSCFQMIKNKKVLAWLCPKMENNLCSLGYKNTVLKAWPLAAQFGRSDNNKVWFLILIFLFCFQ